MGNIGLMTMLHCCGAERRPRMSGAARDACTLRPQHALAHCGDTRYQLPHNVPHMYYARRRVLIACVPSSLSPTCGVAAERAHLSKAVVACAWLWLVTRDIYGL